MKIITIEWKNSSIKIIDQNKLPQRLEYLYIRNLKSLWQAIKTMQVRGAPALGAGAGLGVYLGIKNSSADNFRQFKKELDKVIKYLATSRPTARNLFWGIERIREAVLKNQGRDISYLKKLIFKEAQKIIEEDKIACRKIGYYGANLIKDNDAILTVCNAGILATIDYGTALGVIYRAQEEGKKIKVFACETRPRLQGARLTAWELQRKGIRVTLICDSMAATLMKMGKIDMVMVGADRIALNGDTANKIGTYNLAVLAKFHHIPFYVAAPSSTFDLHLKDGAQIPIEQRSRIEVTHIMGHPIAPSGITVYNPAFDVTPHALITAIITEKGIVNSPFSKNIRRMLC